MTSERKSEILFLDFLKRHKVISEEQHTKCLELLSQRKTLDRTTGLLEIIITNNIIKKERIEEILKLWVEAGGFPPIPGYELIAKLGKGAMGTVFKAIQTSMDRVVALKVMSPHLAKDKQFIERFIREARAVAKLNHENIIKGIDVGDYFTIYYFVMEFIDGVPISEILKREGRIEEKKALEIALQIARALEHAHKNMLIHRDIKPENIMLTKDGVAKLCDLGLAKRTIEDTSLTQSGTAVGTPNYISPEQARGDENVDIRTDIYSLGASLYHITTGELPFPGDNAATVMTKHIVELLIPPKIKFPQLSEQTNTIIIKAMKKHKEERYQTPTELIQDLEKAILGKEIPVTKVEPTHKKRPSRVIKLQVQKKTFPTIIIFVILFLIISIVGAIYLLQKEPAKEKQTSEPNHKPSITKTPDIHSITQPDKKPPVTADEDEAKIALEQLIGYIKNFGDTPAKFKFILSMFDTFFEKYKLSKYQGIAIDHYNNFIKKTEEFASNQISPIIEKAKMLQSEDRLFEASQLLQNLPSDLDFTKIFSVAKSVCEKLISEMNERFNKDKQELEDKISKKEIDPAEKIYNRILVYGTPEMKSEINTYYQKIKDLRKAEFELALSLAEKAYKEFYSNFKDLLIRRNYSKANEFATVNIKKSVFKPIISQLEQDLKDASALEQLEKDTYEGLDKIADTNTEIRLNISKEYTGRIVRKKTNNEIKYSLEFKQISGSVEINYSRLTEEDIVLISNFVLDPNSARKYYQHGLLWFFTAEQKLHTVKKAKENFLEAKSRGAQGTERYLKEIEIYEAELQTSAIVGQLERINQDISKGKYKDAYKSLQELVEKFPGVMSGSKKNEIVKMINKCKAELLIIDDELMKKMFKGKVRILENFKFEATYDFSNESQLNDWETKEIFTEQKPVLSHNQKKGIIHLSGAITLLWKSQVINDVTVEADCIATGDRSIAITLADDGNKKGYMCALKPSIGQWVNWATGIYKYDFNKLDFSRPERAAEAFKKLVTNDELTLKKGEEYKLKASLKGKKITFLCDKGEIGSVEDSSYSGPYVTLTVISQDGASFDNVKISGTFNKDWLKKRILELTETE